MKDLNIDNITGRAVRLTENSTYELMLDGKFIFHVRKNGIVKNDAVALSAAASSEIVGF